MCFLCRHGFRVAHHWVCHLLDHASQSLSTQFYHAGWWSGTGLTPSSPSPKPVCCNWYANSNQFPVALAFQPLACIYLFIIITILMSYVLYYRGIYFNNSDCNWHHALMYNMLVALIHTIDSAIKGIQLVNETTPKHKNTMSRERFRNKNYIL